MIDVSQRQKQPPEVLFKKRCSWKYLEMVSLELEVFSRELTSVTFLKTNKRGGRGGMGGDAY